MASRAEIETRVGDLDRARRTLGRVLRAERAGYRQALEVIGQQAVTNTQRHAPLLTGRLRRSYTYRVEVSNRSAFVEVGSNVVYAPFQEFGTSRQDGKPHLRPGIDEVRPLIGRLLAEAAARRGRSEA